MGDLEALETYVDYDMWQSKLSQAFFSMNQPDEPVIVFIDDEEMSRFFPHLTDPVGSLRSAVLAELRQTDKSTIFDAIDRRLAIWRRGPRDLAPPCLPLLAVTVLAGSRMRNDGEFSQAAYYPRLLSLMTSGSNNITARGIQKHFDLVAEMWQVLDKWIESNQDFLGSSTIYPGNYSRIGYPLSQTLMKASDRERLSIFLQRRRVDQASKSSPQHLLALLRLWLHKPRGFSKAFLDLVQKGSGNPLLLAVIVKLAEEQPSDFPVVEGRVRLDLGLCIDPEDWSVSWVIPVHPRLTTQRLTTGNGSFITIKEPEYGTVYDIVEGALPESVPLMNRSFQAVGDKAVVTKKLRQLWILRMDPSSGRWLSVSDVIPSEQHLLVVQQSDNAEMDDLLSKSAVSGYWKFRGVLFPGWSVYVDVSFTGPIGLSPTGTFISIEELLKPASNLRPKLMNGLELRTVVGGRHFLSGGEPDLQLPDDPSREFIQILLDGRLPGTRAMANGSLFPLRLAGPFTEGNHAVSVDDVTLEFFVHSRGSAAQWEAEQTESVVDRLPSDSAYGIRRAEFVLSRRGKDAAVWFVSPSGKVRMQGEPPISSLSTRLGFPESYQWKVQVPTDTAWVLAERAGKISHLQQITTDPPNFEPLDIPAQFFWRRAASETIDYTNPLWRAFLSQSMQESIHGR
ncbi:hypothetical protein [Arthrobacter psychrochitiniphilus]|uniref:Uncharacterized protein n=1 Tax=Arthrobacter psychrochitiniphilus TaxID=291045 RepID=A0A2V3DW00_9MICC|nr:hypothetical protein [Arthrobacter psychrochitiniphilus]NYG16388.1 hypothetical protein [Arthrobacter psychrochitiniphilus]PXA69459.1 hypothetical protein CVS29_02610 [Arthrobacter psychrochitiniphilus]